MRHLESHRFKLGLCQIDYWLQRLSAEQDSLKHFYRQSSTTLVLDLLGLL